MKRAGFSIFCMSWLLILMGILGSCGAPVSGSGGNGIGGLSAGQSAIVPPPVVEVGIPLGAAGNGAAAYGINPLSIDLGTTVKWTNNDTVSHTVTAGDLYWDSGPLAPGDSFSFTFLYEGEFEYHCTIHGYASESGMIQVSGH